MTEKEELELLEYFMKNIRAGFDNLYEGLDDFLDDSDLMDLWYDYDFILAREIIKNFQDSDWQWLSQNVKLKSDNWKMKVIYCINEDFGIKGLEFLLSMIDETDEVFIYVIDSMRFFLEPEFINRVKSTDLVAERVNQLLKTGDPFDKPMLEEFSRNFLVGAKFTLDEIELE